MTFVIPSSINTHAVSPSTNGNWNSTENSPTGSGVKANGSLPQANSAGDWARDKDASTALAGYNYDFPSGPHNVATDTKVLVWHTQSNAPNRVQADTVANGGQTAVLWSGAGSPSANYRRYEVGGNDTPMCATVSGPLHFILDLNNSDSDASGGSYDNTDVRIYSIWVKPLGMVGNSSSWRYETPAYLFDTIKSSSDTPTFSGAGSVMVDCVDLIQGADYTDKLGTWVRRTGSVIFIDVGFRLGNNSTITEFDDEGLTIISPPNNDPADPRIRITTQACRVYLNLRNNVADTADFSGTWQWGTRAPFDFDQDDSAIVTFASPTFIGMGTFTLGSSITGPATFDDVDEVVFADTGVDIDGSTFRNQNGSHALEMTAGAMDIADMRFESYGSAHAILIDTAGTYNFDNVFFDQSGTNDIETTHASGTVTINISNGGTVPTVTETGAGAVVIVNAVPLSITVNDDAGTPIENARVQVTATETVGTITDGDILLTGLTNGSGVLEDLAFNYEAAFDPSGLDIFIKARQGSVSPYKVPTNASGTLTTAGFSLTIAMQPDE
ncbi:MAG: hypothetical protein ACTSYX_11935 [Candidatus Thorarchaeota archaeon]